MRLLNGAIEDGNIGTATSAGSGFGDPGLANQ
jgi:hypothetical protein